MERIFIVAADEGGGKVRGFPEEPLRSGGRFACRPLTRLNGLLLAVPDLEDEERLLFLAELRG